MHRTVGAGITAHTGPVGVAEGRRAEVGTGRADQKRGEHDGSKEDCLHGSGQNPITSVGQCPAWLTTRKLGNKRCFTAPLHRRNALPHSPARREPTGRPGATVAVTSTNPLPVFRHSW